MHVEATRGFRHVAPTRVVNLLDVLPAHAIRRHGMLRRLGFAALRGKERGNDVVRVRRFCEIIYGAEFDCSDGGGDIAVAVRIMPRASGRFCLSMEMTSKPQPSLSRISTTAYSGALSLI
jgi:hypothetical protein